ncbi:uncharacterized protein MELLADRAFT_113850 [Melampsora larici-populina 98AG31]|uniref:Uncharacterized protein n=1 Tax=Melampsora larici-populina (strain 98AG31 / pathotype 3-4-7) TaxID=747676 RepID=F4SB87_MELLP|nr:uncharacterized protein MELLADRAFT_113850 [Melampsora larici-populina 98AG31]EGF98108.1 hypothetical protein MELLADRAFT_113850 [Melampsora larici-populina 98AG31]
MLASSRAAQLRLWRKIALKHHEETQPDSILAIFLQLGLSESANGPFSLVNKLLESCVPQGFVVPSDEVIEVIQDEESRHKSHPVGLMDLPLEVFDKIIEQLDCMATVQGWDIADEKRENRMLMSGPGDREPYFTYFYNHPPILNSFQTFALTSCEIYECC